MNCIAVALRALGTSTPSLSFSRSSCYFDTTADDASLKQQSELVANLLAEVQQVRASIQASFSQQFDRLKPLDTHFPRKGEA